MILITQAVKYLEPQIRLAAKAGKHKREYKLSLMPERTLEKVAQLAEAPIEAVFTDPKYGKVHIINFGHNIFILELSLFLHAWQFCKVSNLEFHMCGIL